MFRPDSFLVGPYVSQAVGLLHHSSSCTSFPPLPYPPPFIPLTYLSLVFQFLQYWYEMVVWHEKKRGLPVHLWDVNDFALYG